MTTRYLSVDQVARLHRELMLTKAQQSILIAPDKLEAALARPQTTVFGEDAYPTLSEKAAALLESLAIGHPFIDGNKRIAFAAMNVFLEMNGVVACPDEALMYDLVIAVATGELREVSDIAEQLRVLYGSALT